MSDLTDDQIGECNAACLSIGGVRGDQIRAALRELQRHRAAVAADEERVRAVVREVVTATLPSHGGWCYGNTHPDTIEAADRIATRAAKQLATAAKLANEVPA